MRNCRSSELKNNILIKIETSYLIRYLDFNNPFSPLGGNNFREVEGRDLFYKLLALDEMKKLYEKI